MVSQTDIKGLEFTTIEEYFNYIVSSIENGQKPQARRLIKEMSKKQKLQCLNHFAELDEIAISDLRTEAKIMVIESFK